MRLTQHPSNNGVLSAPKELSHNECSAAPKTRVQYSDGSMEVQTYWEPTALEIRALQQGKKVRVAVLGFTMPPIRVEIEE